MPDNLAENKESGGIYTRDNPRIDQIKPYMWKKGQSGNIKGRPKGKTLKEWTKDYLERMTDEERDAFMEGIPKEVIWKMAEGNPTEDKNVSISVPTPILGGMTQAKLENATIDAIEDSTIEVIVEEIEKNTDTNDT